MRHLGNGAAYDPNTDIWTIIANESGAHQRGFQSSIWTGEELFVWGGQWARYLRSGGLFNPKTKQWRSLAIQNAPQGQSEPAIAWSGSEVLVWGGEGYSYGGYLNTGGLYNPSTEAWRTISTNGAPAARAFADSVWAGDEWLIWGGEPELGSIGWFREGGRYSPMTESWTPMATNGAPLGRSTRHLLTWTGDEMFVTPTGPHSLGGLYDPSADVWRGVATNGTPTSSGLSVRMGDKVFVPSLYTNSVGAVYDPAADQWENVPFHPDLSSDVISTFWTGQRVIVVTAEHVGEWDPENSFWVTVEVPKNISLRGGDSGAWTGKELLFWLNGTYVEYGSGGAIWSYAPSRTLFVYQRP